VSATPRRRSTVATLAGVAALLAWATAWAWWSWDPSGLSWHYFADGGKALTRDSGLRVYADQPELQVGPLALLASAAFGTGGTGRQVAEVVMAAVGPVIVIVLAPLVTGRRAWLRVALGAALFVPAWTVLAVRWGHLDDVLAMLAATLAVRAVHAGRAMPAGLAVAAAIATKPWAVGFLPVLLGLDRDRARAAGWAVGVAAAAWLPFFVAAPATARALSPDVPLIPGSGLHTLGVRGRFVPDWGRTVQLLAAPMAGLASAARGQWPGVLLVAVAVRLALDPQDNPYYIGSAAAAALVFDLVGACSTMPWATLLTVAALWQPFVADYEQRLTSTTGLAHWWYANPDLVGWVHLGWAALVVLLVLATPLARRT
jgi:hypothetical protein